MDMRMPVMDGYEATKRIRTLASRTTHPVIIAVTASVFEENRAEVTSIGCDDIVTKPYSEADIVGILQKHLNVKFLYAADETADGDATLGVGKIHLNPEDFQALPNEMVVRFKKSVVALQLNTVLSIIEEIGEHNRPLADALKILAEEYRFDELQNLLDLS
jgi:DNA-binding response OmpR family regulator